MQKSKIKCHKIVGHNLIKSCIPKIILNQIKKKYFLLNLFYLFLLKLPYFYHSFSFPLSLSSALPLSSFYLLSSSSHKKYNVKNILLIYHIDKINAVFLPTECLDCPNLLANSLYT